MILPQNLPAIRDAKLPESYSAAKEALAVCEKLDECKAWADKAAALASYAKQADDKTLQSLSERIRARAISRCGELLKAIAAGQGSGAPSVYGGVGIDGSRSKAARDAGLSERQKNTALRVASVPRDQFEALVEADEPASITELAKIGTKAKPVEDILRGRNPEAFKAATTLLGTLSHFCDDVSAINISLAISGCDTRERERLEKNSERLFAWSKKLNNAVKGRTE